MILNQWLIDDMIIDSLIFGFIKMVNQPERSYTISYNLFTKYNFEPMVDCTQPDIDWYIYIYIYTHEYIIVYIYIMITYVYIYISHDLSAPKCDWNRKREDF